MSRQSLNTIKNWFKTRLKPSQAQFWDTWDSFWHKDEKIPIESINDLESILLGKASEEYVDQLIENLHITDENIAEDAAIATSKLADGADFERKSNKVASLNEESTNVQFPGAKLMFDELANKENTGVAATLDATVLSTAKSYADGLVVGLWDDRGGFDASVNTYPILGGSGTGGAILKGDIWTISVIATSGVLLGYSIGSTVRALANNPGQTSSNWDIQQHDFGYTPENSSKKDASSGYAGLTQYKLNLLNALGTITSWITTNATASFTWLMPEKSGTVALLSDIPSVDQLIENLHITDENIAEDAAIATSKLADGAAFERMSNKVASLNEESTNVQFPGAKLMFDELANKENTGVAATLDATVLSTAKSYADGLVVGLWDDRGGFDASVNTYPVLGGSGTGGAILKGDIWTISVIATSGALLGYSIGSTVRALANNPGQTSSNWDIQQHDFGYTPENSSKKDASSGYAGLTQYKLNLLNALGTITSWITTNATASFTWLMPEKSGTVALISDIPSVDNSIELDINFQDLTAFVYACPVAMKFTSQTSQGTAATLSIALNTNMAQFAQLTVTPAVTGLVILKGVSL